jgi:hypothetical protein
MTQGQYDQLVETRTDQILGHELTAEVYAAHFETQMRRRGKVRKWLCTSGRQFARAGVNLLGSYPQGMW